MRIRSRALVAVASVAPVALLAAPTVAASPPQWTGKPFTVSLTGAAERPGPGDPDGTGTAHLRVNPGQRLVCYELTVTGVENVTAAHIHVAPATAPGPVVVALEPPTDGDSEDCVEVDREVARALVRNPQNYYVNVHSTDFPMGAVRGQLG